MRQATLGGWRSLAALLVFGIVLGTPSAVADGPGGSESTPASERAPEGTPPSGDPDSATLAADTTDAGPPGQGCRPMCFENEL